MQDKLTGDLVPLNPTAEQQAIMNDKAIDMAERLAALQEVKDAAIPDRSRQGAVLQVGEILEVRGGLFRVERISGRRVYLESLPAKRSA